jgi:hypothetical protein
MDLKKILHSVRGESNDNDGKLGVLVDLNVREPSDGDLKRLRRKGLHIEKVIGNKLLGRIAPSALHALEKDDLVREIEQNVKLDPHQSSS